MLWLVRHAESLANAGAVTSDVAAIPLTARGLTQAQQIALACPQAPALVVRSPYRRARQSAQALLDRYPNVPVVDAAVQEFTYLAAARCRDMDTAGRRPLVDAYWARLDPEYCDGEGAESFADLAARAATFLAAAAGWPGFTVVFTHGDFIRAVVGAVLFGVGLADRTAMVRFFELRTGLPLPNGAIVRLQYCAGQWWLGGIDGTHLNAEPARCP
jgi:broad specificity phosphatase PhoE